MQITQLSAVLEFLPVTVIAAALEQWFGTAVYVGNLVSTLYVHRPHRTGERQVIDVLDEGCIGLWVI